MCAVWQIFVILNASSLLRRLHAILMLLGCPLQWLIYSIMTRRIAMGQATRIALPWQEMTQLDAENFLLHGILKGSGDAAA